MSKWEWIPASHRSRPSTMCRTASVIITFTCVRALHRARPPHDPYDNSFRHCRTGWTPSAVLPWPSPATPSSTKDDARFRAARRAETRSPRPPARRRARARSPLCTGYVGWQDVTGPLARPALSYQCARPITPVDGGLTSSHETAGTDGSQRLQRASRVRRLHDH
jgi:hypothetical protein